MFQPPLRIANPNRIAGALTSGIETRSFAHDAAGNMTQDLRGSADLYEFTYNHAGRMATAKKNGTTKATYTHTAEGLLAVRTVTGANPIHHVHDLAGNLIAEIDGTTGWTLREYIWLPR